MVELGLFVASVVFPVIAEFHSVHASWEGCITDLRFDAADLGYDGSMVARPRHSVVALQLAGAP